MKSSSLKLYLTDDDSDDREFMREAIDRHDQSVDMTEFENGLLLFTHFSLNLTSLPDLIILDLNMPIMNGFETLKRLKASETLRNIPVIIMTTSAKLEDRQQCKLLGCAHFIIKPSSIIEFDIIMTLISSYRD